jgi:bifunctional non-homologous end joining protein LigD
VTTRVAPGAWAPQLATLADEPPRGRGWVHEVKLDGYRLLGVRDGTTCRLLTRNGQDWTRRYGEVARAVRALRVTSAVLDGEIVAFDEDGRSSFAILQDTRRRAPVHFVIFDLLAVDGEDLRAHPLAERRTRLEALLRRVPRDGPLRLAERLGTGDPLATACSRGLEGVVSKRADAPYVAGRSETWVKTKCHRRQEFVIVGFTEPAGAREYLGALVLAARDRGALRLVGKVGTGFNAAMAKRLRALLLPLVVTRPPRALVGDRPVPGGVRWVSPRLVVEVAYTDLTRDGFLRHPSFQGLREDKPAEEVELEQPRAIEGVTLTHPDRVLYPEQGITKRGLAEYYEAVGGLMVPELLQRPLSLVRCPSGSGKACFYQKHWVLPRSEGIVTVEVLEEDGDLEPYPSVRTKAGLVSLVQYGALEVHAWGARADRLDAPDRIVFDLDPGPGVTWPDVMAAARDLRGRLAYQELASWVKTSGGKGLHVVVPIERRSTWAEVATFAERMATEMATASPKRYVATAAKARRAGRIYIDWLRNTRGATSVAAWSTRARPGAPVSVPMPWVDLDDLPGADALRVPDVLQFLRGRFRDPWQELATIRQRLPTGDVAPATLRRPSSRRPAVREPRR